MKRTDSRGRRARHGTTLGKRAGRQAASAVDGSSAWPLRLHPPRVLSGNIRSVESAFYEPVGQDSYVATAATAGPWSPEAQHGGPPSALAARALEQHEPDGRQRLARVAIDILRPVPVGKVSLRTRTIRPGRRVTLAEAVMEADGQEVLHARGWRIERPAGPVPEIADGQPPGPLPTEGEGKLPPIFSRDDHGYLASIEWRFMPGSTAPERPGDGPMMAQARAAWTRPRVPLLAGEEPSPMSRALLVADSGSGVGAALPSAEFIFINVDLMLTLPRDPTGAWLLLESATSVGADGTGLAMTRLSDLAGACGRGWQTLLVAPR
jgi:acyl-CoA thioesterase superfamily protein/acyl-Coa thioesterase superfamily protein